MNTRLSGAKKVRSLISLMLQHTQAWSKQLQHRAMLSGWVMLGLGLIALLVEVVSSLPDWFGPIFFGPKAAVLVTDQLSLKNGNAHQTIIHITMLKSNLFLSTLILIIATLLLYILLSLVQPRLFPWPQQRIAYLLTLSVGLLSVGLLLLPYFPLTMTSQWQFCIVAYAIAAHARVAFSKKASWLVEALVLVIVFIILIASVQVLKSYAPDPTFYQKLGPPPLDDSNQLILRIPLLGLQIDGTIQLFQAGIWTLGLLCLHVFTGIGVHERSARQRSEMLVQELTQAQQQLRSYAMHAEELATIRERARVAREVHDTLAQGLAAIKMHLETTTTLFAEHPDLAQHHIEQARALAADHLKETRNSILNLRTAALEGHTLPSALASLVTSLHSEHATNNFHATFCVSGVEENAAFWQNLPPALELACYRVAQEALSNASKHGRAQDVGVELSIEQDDLCLTITDNGNGFDPTTVRSYQRGGGFGIIGMHERLKLLNGRLEVISAPGAGTQVVAMIPLAPAHLSRVFTEQ